MSKNLDINDLNCFQPPIEFTVIKKIFKMKKKKFFILAYWYGKTM
jgi:hypothetical protein